MALWRTGLEKPPAWPPPTSADGVAATLRYAAQRDPIGHEVHAALAMVYLASLAISTTAAAFAFGALLVYAILRLPHTWRSFTVLVHHPLAWVVAAWLLWHLVGLLWSADPGQGVVQLRAFRAVLSPFLIWPVVDRARWLVASFLVGVFCLNMVQLTQWLGFLEPRAGAVDRVAGLMHPIQSGAMCAAALAWYLSAGLRVRGCVLPLVAIGGMTAGWGLVITGSRGAWIAAAVALGLALIIIPLRRPETRRRVAIVAGALAATVLITIVVASEQVRGRLDIARVELGAARQGDLDTNVGYRLASAEAALEIFRSHPWFGVGTGGFLAAAQQTEHAQLLTPANHAHSLYLQALACTGIIGFGLLMAILVLSLYRAWRDPPDHPFADGHFFVLVTWWIGASFDAYQHIGLMMGLLFAVMVLTTPMRPTRLT